MQLIHMKHNMSMVQSAFCWSEGGHDRHPSPVRTLYVYVACKHMAYKNTETKRNAWMCYIFSICKKSKPLSETCANKLMKKYANWPPPLFFFTGRKLRPFWTGREAFHPATPITTSVLQVASRRYLRYEIFLMLWNFLCLSTSSFLGENRQNRDFEKVWRRIYFR